MDRKDKYWHRIDEEKRKDLLRIYNITSSIIHGFKTRMEEFLDNPERLEELCSRVYISP